MGANLAGVQCQRMKFKIVLVKLNIMCGLFPILFANIYAYRKKPNHMTLINRYENLVNIYAYRIGFSPLLISSWL